MKLVSLARRRWFASAVILALALDAGRADADEPALAVPDVGPEMEAQPPGHPERRIETALEAAERWIERGRSEKGLSLLRDVLPVAQAHGTDTTPIRFLMAQALMRLRRYDEAAIVLAELVSEQPDVNRLGIIPNS